MNTNSTLYDIMVQYLKKRYYMPFWNQGYSLQKNLKFAALFTRITVRVVEKSQSEVRERLRTGQNV